MCKVLPVVLSLVVGQVIRILRCKISCTFMTLLPKPHNYITPVVRVSTGGLLHMWLQPTHHTIVSNTEIDRWWWQNSSWLTRNVGNGPECRLVRTCHVCVHYHSTLANLDALSYEQAAMAMHPHQMDTLLLHQSPCSSGHMMRLCHLLWSDYGLPFLPYWMACQARTTSLFLSPVFFPLAPLKIFMHKELNSC